MSTDEKKVILIFITGFICLTGVVSRAQQPKKPFTVADEIGLAQFGDPSVGLREVHFSPDGNYFAVWTERGRLGLNCVEDSLRFYHSQAVKKFLDHTDELQPPSPVWVVNRSGKEGRIIDEWHWLGDSSGVAFREATSGGNQRLVLADLRKKTIQPLTSETESVGGFDVRDRNNYVYSVADLTPWEKWQTERQESAIVGTGRNIAQLLIPDDQTLFTIPFSYHLWAVGGGKRYEVKRNGAAVVPEGSLALSPDGGSVVTILPVPEVPSSWETLYPPPYASSRFRIHAGRDSAARQYVRIDLQTSSVQALTDAPISYYPWAPLLTNRVDWSRDGQAIVLPGTFLKSKENAPSRPCVAVVDVVSNISSCVEMLKGMIETGHAEENLRYIVDSRFVEGDKKRVRVTFINRSDKESGTTEYRHTTDDIWQLVGQSKGESEFEHDGLEVTVKQGLNEPPLLLASNKQTSRVIWDPNPQLKDIEVGQANVYSWRDKERKGWKGALYVPSNFKPGQRFPLVIQTHGYGDSGVGFRPSGIYPTAFAARALAAAGIMVLQVDESCPALTPAEGPCAVSGYESAANQLVSDGLVDPERIGIIGFSRSCFYVMEMLATSSLHLKTASVTDGIMVDYLQYMIVAEDGYADDLNDMVGAKPFGEGLQQWLKRSPGFNLDKITASLLVVGEGPYSLLAMWLPYAELRYLHKPVDTIMLNTKEHVLTNPRVRMASQGGSVDWFRFWLQDYEDPDPAKGEQYARWRELRKMQDDKDSKARAANEKPAPVK